MKTNKPFTKLWTSWRVSKILREFKGSGSPFLCHGSHTFAQLWPNNHLEIRAMAKVHFPEETSDSDTVPELATLFGYCPRGNYETRIQFLELELKRLKSLKTNDKSSH